MARVTETPSHHGVKRSSAPGCEQYDNPWWGFPGHQCHKANQSQREVRHAADRAGEDRRIQRRAEDADDSGIGALHGRLRPCRAAQPIPEGERPDQDEEARQEE